MIEDRKLYPGEYNRAEPGTGDQFVQSATGCMCVLLTSTRDVLGNAPPTATEALRALIRDKLQDGRLPDHLARFWGGRADGQTCVACDRPILRDYPRSVHGSPRLDLRAPGALP